jgi:hypothetical protein
MLIDAPLVGPLLLKEVFSSDGRDVGENPLSGIMSIMTKTRDIDFNWNPPHYLVFSQERLKLITISILFQF